MYIFDSPTHITCEQRAVTAAEIRLGARQKHKLRVAQPQRIS